MEMEEFLGKKYVMVKSEHFDELLKFLDVSYFRRKLACTLRPVQFVERNNDGTYTLYFQSNLARYHSVFVLGEEFDENKPDGTQVRATIRMEGNKMYHRQVETNGRTLNHVYEFFPDEMILTSTGPGLDYTVKRYYVAIK